MSAIFAAAVGAAVEVEPEFGTHSVARAQAVHREQDRARDRR
jgi:hypothetical protein